MFIYDNLSSQHAPSTNLSTLYLRIFTWSKYSIFRQLLIISFIHTAHFKVTSEHIVNNTTWEIVILEKCKLNRQAAITYMEKYSQEFHIHASSQISRFWLLSFSISWFLSYYWMFNNFCLLFIFNQAYSHSFSITLKLQSEFDTFEKILCCTHECEAISIFD